MTTDDRITESLKLAYDMALSGMTAEEIDKEIAARHDGEDQAYVMQKAEDYVIAAQLAIQARDRARARFIAGLGICLIGVLISLYSLLSWDNTFILAYGAILFGAWFAFKNYRSLKRPLTDFVPQRRQIRRTFDRY